MPLWDPSIETWTQYLAKKSYHDERTSHDKQNTSVIDARISEQTKQIVANNDELKRTFDIGYDKVNSTLEWGLDRLSSDLSEIDISIDSLRADFNYNMGILIQESQINNNLLSSLLDKIDSIQKTLDSPMLTQARELYKLGCQLASKGLFDKALESLHKSEEIYDADFFTQYRIGYLYLFGVNDDCNIIDLEKAKHHLLIAGRYAKAEIESDSAFTRLAAESLLLASISVYAQLGENDKGETSNLKVKLISEAKEYAVTSTNIYSDLSEAWFHIAKYSALQNQPDESVSSLREAVIQDRNYAVKVDDDQAFDSVRPSVLKYLSSIRDEKRSIAQIAIDKTSHSLQSLSEWMKGPDSEQKESYEQCQDKLEKAKQHQKADTYFGYLDAISEAENADDIIAEIKGSRVKELQDIVYEAMRQSPGVTSSNYNINSTEIENLESSYISINRCIKEELSNGISSLNHFRELMSKLEEANIIGGQAEELVDKEVQKRREEETKKKEEEEEKRNIVIEQERVARIKSERWDWAAKGAWRGLVTGFIVWVIGCIFGVGFDGRLIIPWLFSNILWFLSIPAILGCIGCFYEKHSEINDKETDET